MYHAIVKRRMSEVFDSLNEGNWQAMVAQFSNTFVYRFAGESPLSGTRSTTKSMAAWWERLFVLFPNAQFKLHSITANGMPWNTTVMTHLTISDDIPIGDAGEIQRYENEFMQTIQIKWGRVSSVVTIEDTAKFVSILPKLLNAGVKEAGFSPYQ